MKNLLRRLKPTKEFISLGPKEKLGYISDYYKVHIILTIIICLFIGYFLNLYIFNPPPEYYASISFIPKDQAITTDISDQIGIDVASNLALNTDDYTIFTYTYYFGMTQTAFSSVEMMKFSAELAAKDIDLIVTDKSYYNYFTDKGMIADLSTIYSPEDLSAFGDDIIYDSNNVPIAISLENSKFLQSYGIDTTNLIVMLSVNSQRVDNSKDVLDVIYN